MKLREWLPVSSIISKISKLKLSFWKQIDTFFYIKNDGPEKEFLTRFMDSACNNITLQLSLRQALKIKYEPIFKAGS